MDGEGTIIGNKKTWADCPGAMILVYDSFDMFQLHQTYSYNDTSYLFAVGLFQPFFFIGGQQNVEQPHRVIRFRSG